MEGNLDTQSRALEAIDVALPYVAMLGQEVAVLGREAAKSAAAVAGKAIWDWIAGRLTSAAGKEAVTDLEKAPGYADNRKAAEAALSKFLKNNPDAFAELGQLLEKAGVTTTSATQTANAVGNGNKVVQVAGSGNNVNIGATRAGKPPKAG